MVGLAKLLGTEDSSSAGQDISGGQIKSETPSKPGVLSGSSEPLSVLGSAIGTPAYMSAEQASGGTLAPISWSIRAGERCGAAFLRR